MSTFTKEQLIEKLQHRISVASGFPESEKAQMDLELARIALASLEAEPVCVIDQSNLDYLNSGSDADVWPASRKEMGDVLLYRTAPPAPVTVPDELLSAMEEVLRISDRDHDAWHKAKAGILSCRAAMLQGADPDFREISNSSTKHFRENAETSTKCWCRTCRPVTFADSHFVVCPECGNKRCPHANDHRHACTGSNEPGQEGSAYPAAPQQEVK
ncbi:hypothetical protein ACVBXD_003201 [Enterobacter hormaechei]